QLRNIQHVQRQLGETILKSGEVFSLNERAGPYTVERGFMEERSYLNRKPATSPGGGVCQFASTLYNAAYRAGLEVLERVPHSQAVFSVPPGQDATIAYGVADLKLQNRYPFPVKIISKIAQDQLRIEIWGKEPPDEFHDL
ncbi:MAG: VanW family protein, partial [Candidatus Binatia bacterium]